MSNSYEKATVQPTFPAEVVEDHLDNLQKLGVSAYLDLKENEKKVAYLYVEDGCYDWDEFHSILQQMLDDAGMSYCYVEGCFYCDKMVPGEFGGFAHFITKADVRFENTGSWVTKHEEMLKEGVIE